jgi:hypothetical protein
MFLKVLYLFNWPINYLLLWNPKFHNRFHKILPLYHSLSLLNPVNVTLSFSKLILILSSHALLGVPDGLSPGFPTNIICEWHIPMCPACATSFVLLDLIALTVLGEEYEWWSSLLLCKLHVYSVSLYAVRQHLRLYDHRLPSGAPRHRDCYLQTFSSPHSSWGDHTFRSVLWN